jgi:anti-anti-sigma factor
MEKDVVFSEESRIPNIDRNENEVHKESSSCSLKPTRRIVMHNQSPEITTETIGDVTVVHFVGNIILDELQIQELGMKLMQLIDKGCQKLVISFGNLVFMSTAFFGKLITLKKELDKLSGRTIFCEIRPEIYEVFAITKLNKLFDIKETEGDALAVMS